MDETIVVSRSALMAQLGGVVRALLYTAGGWLVAKGWLDDGLVQALVPVVLTGGALIWQQLRILHNQHQKVAMADKLPNDVARVK